MNAVLPHFDWDNDMRTVWSGGSVVSGSNMQQFHAAVSRSSFAHSATNGEIKLDMNRTDGGSFLLGLLVRKQFFYSSIPLSIDPSIHRSLARLIYLSLSISIYLYLSLCISIYLYLSIDESIDLSIYPSIYLSIYLI